MGKLDFSLSEGAEEGYQDIIDRASKATEPAEKATVDLNRKLLAVIEEWFDEERDKQTHPVDMMVASMHGVTTICGTILVNMDKEDRESVAPMMRQALIEILDSMFEAVEDCAPD